MREDIEVPVGDAAVYGRLKLKTGMIPSRIKLSRRQVCKRRCGVINSVSSGVFALIGLALRAGLILKLFNCCRALHNYTIRQMIRADLQHYHLRPYHDGST